MSIARNENKSSKGQIDLIVEPMVQEIIQTVIMWENVQN